MIHVHEQQQLLKATWPWIKFNSTYLLPWKRVRHKLFLSFYTDLTGSDVKMAPGRIRLVFFYFTRSSYDRDLVFEVIHSYELLSGRMVIHLASSEHQLGKWIKRARLRRANLCWGVCSCEYVLLLMFPVSAVSASRDQGQVPVIAVAVTVGIILLALVTGFLLSGRWEHSLFSFSAQVCITHTHTHEVVAQKSTLYKFLQ